MKKITILTILLIFLIKINFLFADESIESKIQRAMSAAPLDISSKATIMDVDGKVLRKGTNGWTCMPGVSLIPGDTHPMCNDEVWMKWMEAVAQNKPFSTDVIGVSYMMQGDALVNNMDPGDNQMQKGEMWVQEGPHLMLLIPKKQMLKNLPNDPFAGGPYVMWGKTPLVHVMVPLKAKTKEVD